MGAAMGKDIVVEGLVGQYGGKYLNCQTGRC